jgi:uncharacterized protein YodC (DUF2158 family)
MQIMAIKQGDKVRASAQGPTMVVLAASSTWAMCEWFIGAERRADLFEVEKLEKVVIAQQAQQPQPAQEQQPPGES